MIVDIPMAEQNKDFQPFEAIDERDILTIPFPNPVFTYEGASPDFVRATVADGSAQTYKVFRLTVIFSGGQRQEHFLGFPVDGNPTIAGSFAGKLQQFLGRDVLVYTHSGRTYRVCIGGWT